MISVDIEHDGCSSEELQKAFINAIPSVFPQENQSAVELMVDKLDFDLNKAIPNEQVPKQERRLRFNQKFPKALRYLCVEWQKAVDEALKNLFDSIVEIYKPEELKKALSSRDLQEGSEEYWFPLDRDKLEKLKEVIEDHQVAFLHQYGIKKASKSRIKLLKKRGVLTSMHEIMDVIKDAYVLSHAVESLERGVDFKNVLQIAQKRPWSKYDDYMVEWAKEGVARQCRGLFQDNLDEIEKLASRQAKSQLKYHNLVRLGKKQLSEDKMKEIRKKAVEAKRSGFTWQQFRQEIKHQWSDFARDWDRIAFTEFTNMEKNAQAQLYLEKYGTDVEVFKYPFPDACKICKKMYLNPDGTPRVFKLLDLMANGNNGDKWRNPKTGLLENRKVSRIRYDRKTNSFDGSQGGLLPTLEALHPWCRCPLYRHVKGYVPKVPKYIEENAKFKHIENELAENVKRHFEKEQKKDDKKLAKALLVKRERLL